MAHITLNGEKRRAFKVNILEVTIVILPKGTTLNYNYVKFRQRNEFCKE